MTVSCTRCGADIQDDDVRYEEHAADATLDAYCSVNCVAGVDTVDEDRARNRIFADRMEV